MCSAVQSMAKHITECPIKINELQHFRHTSLALFPLNTAIPSLKDIQPLKRERSPLPTSPLGRFPYRLITSFRDK